MPNVADTLANRILLALPSDLMEELRPHLTLTELHQGLVICTTDEAARDIHFINRGVVSLIKRMKDGRAVEIGARGIEGCTAVSTLLGIDLPLFESVVQVPGNALAIRKPVLQGYFNKSQALRNIVTAYAHASAAQIAQTAACNRLHVLKQRCCRWLLFAHDAARSDTFSITQEFLGMMLGVHRPGVSVAFGKLQKAGMLKYKRGQVTITDRRRLEEASCECYRTIANEFNRLFRAAKMRRTRT
jgi:CRP-like cAMP-binding protein